MTRLERQRIGGEADRPVAQAIADDTAQVVETFACLGADGDGSRASLDRHEAGLFPPPSSS